MDVFHRPYEKHAYHALLASLSGAREGESALDAGCGAGLTLPHLADAVGPAGRVYGLDALPGLLARAAERAGDRARLIRSDLSKGLPFARGALDRIVCNNVLECLPDKAGFVRSAMEALRPGGTLLLGHFDFDSPIAASSYPRMTRTLFHSYADEKQPWMAAADGRMGRKLPGLLRRLGIDPVDGGTLLFTERSLCGGYAQGLIDDIRRGLLDKGFDPELAAAWGEDFEELDRQGAFFFSIQWMYAVCRT